MIEKTGYYLMFVIQILECALANKEVRNIYLNKFITSSNRAVFALQRQQRILPTNLRRNLISEKE